MTCPLSGFALDQLEFRYQRSFGGLTTIVTLSERIRLAVVEGKRGIGMFSRVANGSVEEDTLPERRHAISSSPIPSPHP